MKFAGVLLGWLLPFSVFASLCELKLADVDEEIVRFNDLWGQELQGNTCLLCKRPEGLEGEEAAAEGEMLYFKIISPNEEKSLGYFSCALHESERLVWVHELFIEAPYRNQGVGKQALIQLETILKERGGFDEIALATSSEHKAAFHLYSVLGYQVHSTREQAGVVIWGMKKSL